MDRSSTVARFIQRFREAAPLSSDERRRDRQAMEGQFWWAQSTNSEDGDLETDRSGCGTSLSPPPPTQDGDGSNRDLEDCGSKERAPPPPYGYREQTSCNSSKHKIAVEASCKDAAPQDERVRAKGGCHHPNTDQDQPTLAASSLLPSPRSPGPPGPPSDDGEGRHQQMLALAGEAKDEEDRLQHQQTLVLAGETEVAELAASLLVASLPEHQAEASGLGASSGYLPERSVGAVNTSIEGESFDELANLDKRAGSLLEHCRQLLFAPPTDDADQEATHASSDPVSSGDRTSGAGSSCVNGTSSHTHEAHTREGLEQRVWMLLDNREPLEHWEANLHSGSLLPTGADSDLNLSSKRSNRYDQAARAAAPVEGLEGIALPKTAEVDATHGSTFRKKTISGLGGGESRAWPSERKKKEARGEEGRDSPPLLLRKELMNRTAPSCMVGGSDEAFTCRRSTGLTPKRHGREMALPELTAATGDLLTGMDSVLRKFTQDEIPFGFDRDGPVNVPDEGDFRHRCKMTHASSTESSWAAHSSFGLVRNRPQEDVLAMTPFARRGRQDDSSVASLKYFAEDPVIVALVERAHEIEAELERRRLFGIEDDN